MMRGDVRHTPSEINAKAGLLSGAAPVCCCSMKPITIRIVGGRNAVRDRMVREFKAAKLVVLGVHSTGEEVLQVLELPLADVLLVDVNLRGISGIECVVLLKRRHPSLQIILLTAAENAHELFQSLRAVAGGYMLKSMLSAELLNSVRHLHAGGSPVSAGMTRQMVQFIQQSGDDATLLVDFSQREREVMGLLARGLRYKEIAAHLAVGTATVRTYLERAYAKLGVSNRTEAVARFLQYRR